MVIKSAVIAQIGACCLLMLLGLFDEHAIGRIFARAGMAGEYDRADAGDASRDHKSPGAMIRFLGILHVFFSGLNTRHADAIPHGHVEIRLIIDDIVSCGDGNGSCLFLAGGESQ